MVQELPTSIDELDRWECLVLVRRCGRSLQELVRTARTAMAQRLRFNTSHIPETHLWSLSMSAQGYGTHVVIYDRLAPDVSTRVHPENLGGAVSVVSRAVGFSPDGRPSLEVTQFGSVGGSDRPFLSVNGWIQWECNVNVADSDQESLCTMSITCPP